MSLLDPADYKPPSKAPRYIALGAVVVFLIAFLVWRAVRYKAEEKTVQTFLNTVVAGDLQKAYQLWQPSQSYTFKDFQDDWGPGGYYGPVKSYELESESSPRQSNSVAVTVLLSSVEPFPSRGSADGGKIRPLTIWVNQHTQSLSFPP